MESIERILKMTSFPLDQQKKPFILRDWQEVEGILQAIPLDRSAGDERFRPPEHRGPVYRGCSRDAAASSVRPPKNFFA
jgi:hypothetical protein